MKTFVFRAGGSLKAALCCAVALALVGFTAAFACDSLFLPPKQAFCASNGRSLPIYSVQTSEKKAAIGINCAWDDRDILPMLSTLQQNGVHATFFLCKKPGCHPVPLRFGREGAAPVLFCRSIRGKRIAKALEHPAKIGYHKITKIKQGGFFL